MDATGRSLPTPAPSDKKPLHVARLHLPGFDENGQREGPSLGPMFSIHRGPDGFIALGCKHGEDWQSLGAMSVQQPILPGLVAHLEADAYFGLNTGYRTGFRFTRRHVWRPIPGMGQGEELVPQWVRQRTERTTGLAVSAHTQDNLRWLNVCHVDVDCYKAGLSVGQALAVVVDLQDSGQLPPATAFVRSGRGLWLLWYLVDHLNPAEGEHLVHGVMHTPNTPQRASRRALALYAKVQRALTDSLDILNADLGAADGVRYAPVPGTMKTAVGQRVVYWLQLNASGQAIAYTLTDLAQALDVPVSFREHPVIEAALSDAPKDARLSEAGKRGWVTRWQNALADFEILRRLRGGGFKDGQSRHRGAFFYALLLSRSSMAWPDVLAKVQDFGTHCWPPLPPADVKAAVRQAAKRPKGASGYLSNGRLLAELHVTDTEATYLSFLLPKPAAVAPTTQRLQARREAILAKVQELRRIPSPREMAKLLEPLGLGENHTTIWRDYKALGFNVPRRREKGGRPPTLPYTSDVVAPLEETVAR